ncbi:hypothetical protein CaCOL14_009850 [Colletotrichum acutatum]
MYTPPSMANSQSSLLSTASSSVIDFIAAPPLEMSALIFSHLDNCDLKALQLTCKKLANQVRPHLRFKLRHLDEDLYDSDDSDDEDGRPEKPPRGVTFWYFRHCKDNIEYLEIRQDYDAETLHQHLETAKQLEFQLPLDIAYTHYQGLLAEQNKVLSTSADIAAFEWALEDDRFPSLRRITLTPAAHGILFHPLYPTPDIRALPYGFNYPLPRGWPVPPKDGDKAMYGDWKSEDYKECWRGFRHVARILARQKSTKIEELMIDGNQLWSGFACSIFYAPEPCVEYDNLIAAIKKPGFTTLRLSLIVGGQETNNYFTFRNGRLRKALEADLRHFSLKTGEDDDLENGNLSFALGHGNDRELLFAIRDTLGWQERTASTRPHLLIRDFPGVPLAGRAVWVEDAPQRFLYEDGENPYPIPPRNAVVTGQTITWKPGSLTVGHGFGTEIDALEPRFERPYESADKLIEMGISRDWKGAF